MISHVEISETRTDAETISAPSVTVAVRRTYGPRAYAVTQERIGESCYRARIMRGRQDLADIVVREY